MAKQAKEVLPSEHVPVILPIPDPDWAVEIKKFYPGEIDRDLVPGRAPPSSWCVISVPMAPITGTGGPVSVL